MQNIKYHLINIISVIIFSYITALTINQIIKLKISPEYTKNVKKPSKSIARKTVKSFDQYNKIIESGFFPKVDAKALTDEGQDKQNIASQIENLTLMGTITGPSTIAMAMIQKKGEKDPEIFKLWSNVYGSKLIAIMDTKVYLKTNGERAVLELYGKKIDESQKKAPSSSGKSFKQNFSRSEIKQNVLNNLDNAMKGLVAGPYNVDGKVAGFMLKTVRPYNILYKLGARSGDIVKRVNGHALDSTQKLYSLWESLKNEPKFSIDIERGNQSLTFDLNITE